MNCLALEKKLPDEFKAKYELKHPLGRGAFGQAHVCVDRKDGKEYCAKIIEGHRLGRRANREATNLTKARNAALSAGGCKGFRYIAKCEFVATSRHYTVIVLEYARGPTLEAFINKELLNVAPLVEQRERLARRVCRQLLRALSFLEKNHIIHGDLKPANIVLTHAVGKDDLDTIQVRLVDFGFSKDLNESPLVSKAYGTAAYLAPERRHEGVGSRNTFKSEVWAISCIAYEIVTGLKAFHESGLQSAALTFQEELLVPLPFECKVSTAKNKSGRSEGWVMRPLPVSYEFRDFVERTRATESHNTADKLVFDLDGRLTVDEALAHRFIALFFDVDEDEDDVLPPRMDVVSTAALHADPGADISTADPVAPVVDIAAADPVERVADVAAADPLERVTDIAAAGPVAAADGVDPTVPMGVIKPPDAELSEPKPTAERVADADARDTPPSAFQPAVPLTADAAAPEPVLPPKSPVSAAKPPAVKPKIRISFAEDPEVVARRNAAAAAATSPPVPPPDDLEAEWIREDTAARAIMNETRILEARAEAASDKCQCFGGSSGWHKHGCRFATLAPVRPRDVAPRH